ncbi:DUF2252 domain-containing protein [Pelomonas sp. P7]|uniref:DUF2252 domain-containing protein n=1 Tax=Pelomonas caseinilytica TaxID=2906763 RepID=A0ABS8X8I1_9BURK|nr:DUF2252 family protein [Pelomonas sp. P7]MCE4535733.1 DUF2252 domain-containing protein [Pelomonas sp. P7]
MDVIRALRDYNAGRDPERLHMKFAKMRRSPFVFLRGAAHLFHARLRRGALKPAPVAWCCGDMHLENFGSYQGANGLAYFDINDFDESALAPASADPLHLLTSLWLAADELGLDEGDAQGFARATLDAYADAMAGGKAYWLERDTADGPVRLLLDQVATREQAGLLERRCQGRGRRLRLRVDGRHALPASAVQQDSVRAFMAEFAAARQDETGFFEVLDAARRVAGTGSLGLDRYVVLVRGDGGAGGAHLLDLKPARASTLAPIAGCRQPPLGDEAQREVAVQQRMQAVSMGLLQPVRWAGRPYVLRALQPGEDRLDLGALDRRAGGSLAHSLLTMGRLMAWAQLRSAGRQGSEPADALIDFGRRGQGPGKWRDRLVQASRDMAGQVRKDAAVFNEAWDDGVLAA